MATYKSTIPLAPGPRKTGAVVQSALEASAQTFPAGCLLIKSAGSIQMHTTSHVSVNIYGIAMNSGKSGSADGVKTNAFFRAERDRLYKGAVSGSIAQSQMGNTVALSQNTAGAVFVVTAATASDSSVANVVGFAEGCTASDTNPIVYFTFVSTKIQEG